MLNRFQSARAKLNRMLNRPYPFAMQLEVTNRCNMHCIMCPMHCPSTISKRPIGDITIESYEQIVSEFTQIGGKLLIPQGAGESFMHPQFLEMLRLAKKKYNLLVSLNSNGSLVSDNVFEQLIALGIDEFGFSIDAADRSSFETITGTKLYDQVVQNVHSLLQIRKKHRTKKPLIKVLLVDQEANHNSIPGYIQQWITHVDEVVIQTERVDSGRCLKIPRTEKRLPCRHLFETVFVQWDGDLVICCEDWNSETSIGNLNHASLKSIWFGSQLQKYRSSQLENRFEMPPICRTCQAWIRGKKIKEQTHELLVERTALTTVIRRAG